MMSHGVTSDIMLYPESGFGGWADEKIKTAREVAPLGQHTGRPMASRL
jgi:hypothetical protein